MEYNTKAYLKYEARPSWRGWSCGISVLYLFAFGAITTFEIYREMPSFAFVTGFFFLLGLVFLVAENESLSMTARDMDKEAGILLEDLNRLQLAYWSLEKEQAEYHRNKIE